jgi:outer membrane receptor for ferrienterochelin and colicins
MCLQIAKAPSIGWQNQVTYHKAVSYFGLKTYDGLQKSLYSNLMFQSYIGNTKHQYKNGGFHLCSDKF